MSHDSFKDQFDVLLILLNLLDFYHIFSLLIWIILYYVSSIVIDYYEYYVYFM